MYQSLPPRAIRISLSSKSCIFIVAESADTERRRGETAKMWDRMADPVVPMSWIKPELASKYGELAWKTVTMIVWCRGNLLVERWLCRRCWADRRLSCRTGALVTRGVASVATPRCCRRSAQGANRPQINTMILAIPVLCIVYIMPLTIYMVAMRSYFWFQRIARYSRFPVKQKEGCNSLSAVIHRQRWVCESFK